jgi:hypothetical protein
MKQAATALDPFLEVLRANQFPAGLSHRLRALQILDAQEAEYAPYRLRTLLCPIFATNPDEQRRFYELFDRHYPHFAGSAPSDDKPAEVLRGGPATTTTSPSGWRTASLVAALALAVIGGAYSILPFFQTPPTPRPPAAPASLPWALTAPYQEPQTTATARLGSPVRPHWQQVRLPVFPAAPPHEARWPWAGLPLIPVLLWGLLEAWAWRRRQVLLLRGETEPLTSSSFRRVPLTVRTASQADFAATLRRLRRPTPGPLRLHIGKSVAATVQARVFPELRYEPVFRRPEYLVLIDRTSARDHQAALFEELAGALDRRGLLVAAYTFSADPRVCFHIKTGRSVYLADLFQRSADHRLIIFADGDRFISGAGEPSPAGNLVLRWHQRVILTPREPEQWGRRELYLARSFLLLPATAAALAASVDHFDPDHSARLSRPSSEFDHREPDLDQASPEDIRRYLGDDSLYRWVCACALYPQLQWDVTLQLGFRLNPGLLSETNLLKLVRLPWFRRGSIPVALQHALAESLGAQKRQRLRAAILELFEETRPAEAAAAHRLEIAIQKLDILPEERRRILEDETVAQVVADSGVSPGALVASPALRRALFPYGLPTLGFRAGIRRALAVFGILAIGTVGYARWRSAADHPVFLTPLVAAGKPADWWFVFKFNSKAFPACGNGAQRTCPFGGTVQSYSHFGQQFAFASSDDHRLQKGGGCVGDTTADPVGATFSQVYNGNYFYVVWNDQFDGDPMATESSPAGHSKGMLAWDGQGNGVVMQVSTPSWPAAGSTGHPRKNDGNTLGCVKDDDVLVSQHFFALRLNRGDVVAVLRALENASVVTDPHNLQVVKPGGPAEIQALVANLGKISASQDATKVTLSSGVQLLSKPSKLHVPPWQMVSAMLGGEPLRVASWWNTPEIPSTTAKTAVGCWDHSLERPGAVEIATSGIWNGTSIGLEGIPQPDGNHAKVGVSTGTHPYAIFGDLNQQGALSGKCGSSQNGRGGLFYVIEDSQLATSVWELIAGATAPSYDGPTFSK